MATNHTTNYQLNLWEPADAFVRSEFNENSSKIDAALGEHRDALAKLPGMTDTLGQHSAALTTLTAQSATHTRCAVGSYTGTGEASKTLTFPFTPQFVIVCQSGSAFYLFLIRGQSRVYVVYGGNSAIAVPLSWSSTGVTMSNLALNSAGQTYHYFAIG